MNEPLLIVTDVIFISYSVVIVELNWNDEKLNFKFKLHSSFWFQITVFSNFDFITINFLMLLIGNLFRLLILDQIEVSGQRGYFLFSNNKKKRRDVAKQINVISLTTINLTSTFIRKEFELIMEELWNEKWDCGVNRREQNVKKIVTVRNNQHYQQISFYLEGVSDGMTFIHQLNKKRKRRWRVNSTTIVNNYKNKSRKN